MEKYFRKLVDKEFPLTIENKKDQFGIYFFFAGVTFKGYLKFGYKNITKKTLVSVVVDGTESIQDPIDLPNVVDDCTIISVKSTEDGFNKLYQWITENGFEKCQK